MSQPPPHKYDCTCYTTMGHSENLTIRPGGLVAQAFCPVHRHQSAKTIPLRVPDTLPVEMPERVRFCRSCSIGETEEGGELQDDGRCAMCHA